MYHSLLQILLNVVPGTCTSFERAHWHGFNVPRYWTSKNGHFDGTTEVKIQWPLIEKHAFDKIRTQAHH